MVRRLVCAFACLAAVVLSPGAPRAQGSTSDALAVAAASDLQSVLPAIAERFQQATGHPLALTFGSSGVFFAQIQQGAPFDLFFSADSDYPAQLQAAGDAVAGTLQRYARGRLVLWTRRDSGIDVSPGLSVLTDARVRHIAIANPEHAPYGRAAMAALDSAGVTAAVRAKLVLGENISQAAQFAQSGNAEVGLIALSLAVSPVLAASGRDVDVPPASYPAIDQAAIVLRRSTRQDLARQFLAFVASPEIVRLLEASGFSAPATTGAPAAAAPVR